METVTKTNTRNRRSEKLASKEHTAYKNKVASFDTKIDAAEFFGFTVTTLDAILLKGSGKPGSILTIREKIGTAA